MFHTRLRTNKRTNQSSHNKARRIGRRYHHTIGSRSHGLFLYITHEFCTFLVKRNPITFYLRSSCESVPDFLIPHIIYMTSYRRCSGCMIFLKYRQPFAEMPRTSATSNCIKIHTFYFIHTATSLFLLEFFSISRVLEKRK